METQYGEQPFRVDAAAGITALRVPAFTNRPYPLPPSRQTKAVGQPTEPPPLRSGTLQPAPVPLGLPLILSLNGNHATRTTAVTARICQDHPVNGEGAVPAEAVIPTCTLPGFSGAVWRVDLPANMPNHAPEFPLSMDIKNGIFTQIYTSFILYGMFRNELKFFINAHQKNIMANKLSKICQRDSFCDADGGYLISSLYFDDYTQSAFFDKLSGIKDRKKFRIRVYNYQSNVIKLERKIKRGNVIEKSHIQISKEEYESLVRGDVSFLKYKNDTVAKDFYLSYRTKNLRPRVVVEYRREAFMYPYGDVRITFDSFLRAGAFQKELFANGYMTPAIPQDQIILEVKYTSYFPDVVRNIIQIDNLQWQSSSKYAKCFVVGM